MLLPVPQPGSSRRRPARRRHSAGPRRPALSAVAPARSLPLPLAATPSPGASTQAFPRLQCLSGLTGISRPRGLTPSYTDRHTHAILTQTSSLLFPLLPLLARLPPTRSTPCRRHPASTGKPARKARGWMAALVLTSQADSGDTRRRRTQAAGAGASAAAVKAGLLPSPQLLKLSPPPLLLLLPPPPPPLPQLHAPGPPGGRASLPQAPPPRRCWMVSGLSGYGPKTQRLGGRRLLLRSALVVHRRLLRPGLSHQWAARTALEPAEYRGCGRPQEGERRAAATAAIAVKAIAKCCYCRYCHCCGGGCCCCCC